MLLITHWTDSRKSQGFKPGDIVLVKRPQEESLLVRYVGIARNGIPDTPYNRDLLLFSQSTPVHPFDNEQRKFYYLATKKSSSSGFVDPSTVFNLEGVNFLNEWVKNLERDIKVVGNIPDRLWHLMEQHAPKICEIVYAARR